MLPREDIKPLIGSRVLAGKAALLSGEHAVELRALLEARGVLVFPRVGFSHDEQVAFTRTLGTCVFDSADEAPYAISLDPAAGGNVDWLRASFYWHFDGYMNEQPILASVLCAEVVAGQGGETEFCNTYAAYAALDDGDKAALAGLRAVHALAAAQRAVEPEPSLATFRQWLQVRSAELPLVWRHRSGRRSLVIGNTAAGVIGMDLLAGQELLVRLRYWATQERFHYRHHWQVGDAVIWDNTGTLHRAMPYDPASGRRMVRTKLAGEEPVAG